jgi:tetratricopeptide (TPR) repeat protein
MFDKKNPVNPFCGAGVLIFALALLFSGCTPAGPNALLKGKKYFDNGNLAAALAQFERATKLMPTNAPAWNYYGVALQRAGQNGPAAEAYQKALSLNRDLAEAHFNLGGVWLDLNRPDAAKAEFTTYNALRHNSDPAGLVKLGTALLRLNEIPAAEKCFTTLRDLNPLDPEADNGLGLACIQRRNPQDALKWFASARQKRLDFAPALLNLAATSDQYLNDKKSALSYYRAYLALKPKPNNWEEVNSLASSLELQLAPPPVVVIKTSPPPVAPKPAQVVEAKPAPSTNIPIAARSTVTSRPAPVVVRNPPPAQPTPTTQVVQVKAEPPLIVVPKSNTPVTVESITLPMPEEPEKKGFFQKWFGTPKAEPVEKKFDPKKLTPLPAPGSNDDLTPTKPANPAPPPVPVRIARYNYLAPHKPDAGDRRSASGAFTKARSYEQEEKWVTAMQWYQQAAEMDPSWFEAQFNTGVLAHRLRNFPLALPCYENALAIQPEAQDVRYNFSLALKAANYPLDAAEELKKILAIDKSEVRAHLALANIYAQTLKDSPQARQHYLTVLKLDPDNPQAADIRAWLQENP